MSFERVAFISLALLPLVSVAGDDECEGAEAARACIARAAVAKDAREKLRLYEKACAGGSAKGCSLQGWLLTGGLGIAPNPARALELFKKACAGGYPQGCYNAGNSIYSAPATENDYAAISAFYGKACAGGVEQGCFGLRKACAGGIAVACEALPRDGGPPSPPGK